MKNRHAQRGTSLPETAIILAATLSLLLGIIDFGRALYTYHFVAYIAGEGARWAMVRGSASCTNVPGLDHCNASGSDIQTYVQGLSEGATNPSSISVNTATNTLWPGYHGLGNAAASCTAGSNAPNCIVNVQVTYPFRFMMPYMPGGTITMSSTSEMVIAQ